MSFVRMCRPQLNCKRKGPACPKKATKKEWVDTVNDLSVHKLTPAELNHRHEIHKSHNQAAAQWELKEKALERRLRQGGSEVPLDESSLNIIRDVFSDQQLLRDVLDRSDRALALVKDLFGDAPHRQSGHPSVTKAPNCDSDTELPVRQRPDRPTPLSLLSQSMMAQEALNELENSEEDLTHTPASSSDSPVVRRVNGSKMKAQSQESVAHEQKAHPKHHRRSSAPDVHCSCGILRDDSAFNPSVTVQRVRPKSNKSEDDEPSSLISQTSDPELLLRQSGTSRHCRNTKCLYRGRNLDRSSNPSVSGDQSTLVLLQAMLGQVEEDLDSLSPDTASAQSANQFRTQCLTGFSVALVSTLGRLVHLLKQREDESRKEAKDRRRLQSEVNEQRSLIDALTAEAMTLREEATSLRTELREQTAAQEQKLDSMVLVMGELGLLNQKHGTSQAADVGAAVRQFAPISPEQTQDLLPPAVLLFPPQQVDKRQQSPETHCVQQHHEVSPLELLLSPQDAQTRSPASSLHSQPLTNPPSSSSTSSSSSSSYCSSSSSSGSLSSKSRASAQVIRAEIAQLSRQNELIKVQLTRGQSDKSGGPGGSGGPHSRSTAQSRLSSGGAGGVTVQTAAEGRVAVLVDMGRRCLVPLGEPLTPKMIEPEVSIDSMEQRLLELDRQSLAARVRLLELIEVQRKSTSVRASTSTSPIPPSAFSPEVAGNADASALRPEQELRLHSGRGGPASYPGCSRGRTTESHKETNRQREGWSALSSNRK